MFAYSLQAGGGALRSHLWLRTVATHWHRCSHGSVDNRLDKRQSRLLAVDNRLISQFRFAHGYEKQSKRFSLFVLSGLSVVGGILLYVWWAAPDWCCNMLPFKSFKNCWTTNKLKAMKCAEERYDLSTKSLLKLPEKVPYLLIGAGTASFSAARAIRAHDAVAKILIIGEEKHKPYMRPPLTKQLWFSDDRQLVKELKFKQWNGRERDVYFEHPEYYVDVESLDSMEHGGISVVTGRRVTKLNIEKHTAHMDNGQCVQFEKCLIATGGYPVLPKVFAQSDLLPHRHYTLFRDVDDFLRINELCSSSHIESIVVVGGSFLGSELACALSAYAEGSPKLRVLQVFPESGCMANVLPSYLSSWTTRKLQGQGVQIISNANVTDACLQNGKVVLHLDNGQIIKTDHVIIATGIKPNVQLAEGAGLEVDPRSGGFLCDAELRARSDVWVAGDCCSFYDIKLGRRRVEHHDHAVVSGRLAGENMAGNKKQPYWHQSMFWSDLGPEVGYEAIGLVDSTLPTVGVFAKSTEVDTDKATPETESFSVYSTKEAKATMHDESTTVAADALVSPKEDYGKGVVFYFKGKRIVGIVLWNVLNCMPIARKLIMDGQEYDDFTEVAKLFNLYGSVEKDAD